MDGERARGADTAQGGPSGVARRSFLTWTGAVGVGALIGAARGNDSGNVSVAGPAGSGEPVLAADAARLVARATRTVRRPSDQLLLTFTFYDCEPDLTASPPVLRSVANPNGTTQPAIAVSFGNASRPAPMHVQEQVFPLVDSNLPSQAPIVPPPTTVATPGPPIPGLISGRSTLVFLLPDSAVAPGSSPLTITTRSLLDFAAWTLSVAPNAVPPFSSVENAPSGIGAPTAPSHVTSIELPYKLILSPPAIPRLGGVAGERTIFVNATAPVTHGGWTELWHTRLAALVAVPIPPKAPTARTKDAAPHPDIPAPPKYYFVVDEADRNLRTLRAVWATDADFPSDYRAQRSDAAIATDDAFVGPLKYVDRYDLVRLTSDFGSRPGDAYGPNPTFIPQPVTADQLMLSPLGAWLDAHGLWDLPERSSAAGAVFNTSLVQWRQRTVQGRDSYVRTVRKGFLFPWGTRASLVTVTEREFTVQTLGTTKPWIGTYLRQKTFIVITDPVTDYAGNSLMPFGGLNLPFTSVTALTTVTPDFNAPKRWLSTSQQPNEETIFQPTIGPAATPTPYAFHYKALDRNGDTIDFRTPVLWVDSTVAFGDSPSNLAMINEAIAKWGNGPSVDMHGQRVTMAAPAYPKASTASGAYTGDTQLVLESMAIGSAVPTSTNGLVPRNQPALFPAMSSAHVNLPQAAAISGNAIPTVPMAFEPSVYLADGTSGGNGFTNNRGGVFLATLGSSIPSVEFDASNGGGAFTPNLSINGFSRELGPASGDLAQLAAGTFDPANVFGLADAKLLGGISLQDILSVVSFGNGDNAQAFTVVSVEHQNPHRIVTTVDWHPEIHSGPSTGIAQNIFAVNGDPQNSLDLHAQVTTYLAPTGSTSTSIVTGQLRNFTLQLFGDSGDTHFIDVPFDSLTFQAQSGKKTDVHVAIGSSGVQFRGALEFVQDLASFLQFDGSGLTIDTAGDAITAELTLAIPTITVGVLSLLNMAFSAGVAIPYSGDPVRFEFAFSSRENPFQIEVMIFSGGGFVGLGVGADGVELLEFSFDFGLGYSIDIGIASGQVSLTAGIYYECDKSSGTQEIDLTAWVKASGGISALGCISVSVELYLGLSYQSDGTSSSLAGDASLTISVHIIFFGFSVSFDVHEQFAGTGSNPNAVHAKKRAGIAGPADDPAPADNYFGAVMSESDWVQYCTSFALDGVGQ